MIETEVRDRVGLLTINRPDARNALTPSLQYDLLTAFDQLDRDPEVGAILLTGAGGAFCSGGDVKAMMEIQTADLPTQVADLARRQMIVAHIRESKKVVVARIQGAATGAGLAIALACDLRICDDSARFGAVYARLALTGDFGISWLLASEIGGARARHMLLTAGIVDAKTALSYGIVHELVEAADLDRHSMALAATFAQGPRSAYMAIKRNLGHAGGASLADTLQTEAEALVAAKTSQEHREAVSAFVEKRPAVFTSAHPVRP
jgi:enoyl-CoA hydratase/carnithine racemase